MDDHRWRDESWLAGAHAWIDDRLADLALARVDDITQPHVYPWSTVLRVPVAGGPIWFKANADPLRHEAALVQRLSARRPDVVPPLLAADPERGWMLMPDAGEVLSAVLARERSLERWLDVLGRYAEVQLEMTDDVAGLLALGVPDRRLTVLPEGYARLMEEIDAEPRFRDATGRVVELCEELAAYDIAETLQHDDLHDGQVFVRAGRHRVMDWGDSCISHPFFSLSVTLEGVIAWGLDDEEHSVDTGPFLEAYLAPFARRYDADLAGAARTAMRLGWACRAVNGHVPGNDGPTHTRLRMFLDGHP